MVEAAEHGAARNRGARDAYLRACGHGEVRRSSLLDPLVRPRIIVEVPILVEHALQMLFAPKLTVGIAWFLVIAGPEANGV